MRAYTTKNKGVEAPIEHLLVFWWARQDSNLRHHRYERRVLTTELRAHLLYACKQAKNQPWNYKKGPEGPFYFSKGVSFNF